MTLGYEALQLEPSLPDIKMESLRFKIGDKFTMDRISQFNSHKD